MIVFVATQRHINAIKKKGHVSFGILAVGTNNMTYIEPDGTKYSNSRF